MRRLILAVTALAVVSLSVAHAVRLNASDTQSHNWICEPYGDSHYCGSTDENTDSLDPNDCSRGIDEANQEACDLGGAQ